MGNESSKGGGGGPTPGAGPAQPPVQQGEPSPGTRPQLKPPPRDPLYHSAYQHKPRAQTFLRAACACAARCSAPRPAVRARP
jgi:hypothetical protein